MVNAIFSPLQYNLQAKWWSGWCKLEKLRLKQQIHPKHSVTQRTRFWDFPDGLMIRTLRFHYRELKFGSLVGELRSVSHAAWPKKKTKGEEEKEKKQGFSVCSFFSHIQGTYSGTKHIFRDPSGWLVLNVTIQYPGKGKEHEKPPREVTPPTTASAISNYKAGLRSVFPPASYRLARHFKYSMWITGGVDLRWALGNPCGMNGCIVLGVRPTKSEICAPTALVPLGESFDLSQVVFPHLANGKEELWQC